jgi:hypothetical protein
LEVSASRLSRIETGQVAPDIHVVRSMLDLYEIPGDEWESILTKVRDAKQKSWWQNEGLRGQPVSQRVRAADLRGQGYVALEAAALAIQDYSLGFVHGLLQVEPYMRAVLETAPISRSAEQFEKQVTVRLRRAERLLVGDGSSLDLVAVIDEGARWAARRSCGNNSITSS